MNSAVKVFYSDEGTGFIAIDENRPGCSAWGGTRAEAMKQLADEQFSWDCASVRARTVNAQPIDRSSVSPESD